MWSLILTQKIQYIGLTELVSQMHTRQGEGNYCIEVITVLGTLVFSKKELFLLRDKIVD